MNGNTTFKTLYHIDVNEHTETKDNLTYLSWAWAWAKVKGLYPDASYEVYKDDQHRPYVCDPTLGYMVFVTITIDNQSHEMWLPVMDSKHKAMKSERYAYSTKYGDKTVEPATMTDINKTIMRALVKALAMHGLGLYIYAGEDVPEGELASADQASKIVSECKRTGVTILKITQAYKVAVLEDLTKDQANEALNTLMTRRDKLEKSEQQGIQDPVPA